MSGALPAGFAVTGVTGIPVAFVLVGVLLSVFSVGYTAMARRIAHSGALYAYVTQGLGRPTGLAAALVALVSYLAFVGAALGGVGAAASGLVTAETDASPPWWLYALAGWAIAAVLGVLHVEVSGRMSKPLLPSVHRDRRISAQSSTPDTRFPGSIPSQNPAETGQY